MEHIITIDIETIPTQREDVKQYISSKVTHPGNISKAETIAKWNEESRPAAIEEAIAKTGLDGAFGQVVCIGISVGDIVPSVFIGPNETDVLTSLNVYLDENVTPNHNLHAGLQACIVGHNVSAFDLRFLLQRHMVNKVKPHPIIARAAQARPWESDKVYDTMIQFAGVGNRISLDKLCLAFGMEGKGDISGADVWPMWQAGKHAEIAEYCLSDVRKTREAYKRMTFQ